MMHRIFSFYLSIPAGWRRFFVAILVPIQEYVLLEPCRRAVGAAAKSHPNFALELAVVILIFALLMVAVISLFFYEFFSGVGSKVKSKPAGYAFLLFVFGWVIIPIYFINLIWR